MESAIPPHLQTARSRHRRVENEYRPPYASLVARHKPTTSHVVMAYFGAQYHCDPPAAATKSLADIAARFSDANGPMHSDRAHYVDQAGFSNVISLAYWDDVARFDAWFASAREAWTGQSGDGIGRFIEVLRPTVARYETLFSSPDRAEGVAAIADGMSGEVQEHAYWGGMRDRIPLSQTSDMAPGGKPSLIRDGRRLRVVAHNNLCLIRSGQDWSDTEASERKMYLEGMDFLRDKATSIGCYCNRYRRGAGTSRTCSGSSANSAGGRTEHVPHR